MITTLMMHDIVRLTYKRMQNNGSRWISLKLTDNRGDVCEITVFHEGSSTLLVEDADALPTPHFTGQNQTGSAAARSGSDTARFPIGGTDGSEASA